MARMAAWERIAEARKAAAAVEAQKKANALKQAKAKADAAKAAKAVKSLQTKEAQKRRAFVERWKNAKPYNGTVRVGAENLPVKNGVLVWASRRYLVSADGRAVFNEKNLLIGEIVGRELRKPSAAFMDEMKIIGVVH